VIGSFLLMEVLCGLSGMIGLFAQPETERGKVGERSTVMFGALKVVAPTCVN
jgi:hypothetical protein